MPLINCKVEFKLKWTKYCVLSATGADNRNANSNNIISIIKDKKLYVLVLTLQSRDNQRHQNFLAKDLKDQFIGMNLKQKVTIETN